MPGRHGSRPSVPRATPAVAAPSIKIRDYESADRRFFERGLLALLKDEAPYDPLKIVVPPREWGRTQATWLMKQVRTRGGHLLIAEIGPKRVGFVVGARERASPKRRAFEPARPCSIYSLYVAPEHRRRGIGNNLMNEIERRFHRARRDFVHLMALSGNARAVELYRARGYVDRVLFLGKWLQPRADRRSRSSGRGRASSARRPV